MSLIDELSRATYLSSERPEHIRVISDSNQLWTLYPRYLNQDDLTIKNNSCTSDNVNCKLVRCKLKIYYFIKVRAFPVYCVIIILYQCNSELYKILIADV